MGRVWLCEEGTAEHPFFLEEEGVNLYSFEELCFYLYKNTGTLPESFYNEKLCQWIGEELGLEGLSARLLQGIGQERSGCWCTGQILQEGGFYNSREVEEALVTAERMENKGPLDRAKLRGDRLLKAEKYKDAVSEYRKIILQAEEGQENGMAIGCIWHNIGTAYARQMLFEQAAECYGKAYQTGQKEESKEAYLLALACRDGQGFSPAQDRLAGVRQELKEKKQAGDRSGYEKLLESTLLDLRTEYRKSE